MLNAQESAQRRAFDAFGDWLQSDQSRVKHEWAKEWDGTEAHGIAINDRQCDRIDAARNRLGVTDEILRRFRV